MNAVKLFLVGWILTGVSSWGLAATHEWSPVMGDARALERSVRDLSRVLERARDPFVDRVAARLSESVCSLVEHLRNDACIEDVRSAQSEVVVWFERVVAGSEGHQALRGDSRMATALDRFARQYNRVESRINELILPPRVVSRPWLNPPVPPVHILPIPVGPGAPWPNPMLLPNPWTVPGVIPGLGNLTPGSPTQVLPNSPGRWHQSHMPGYVSPGDWHYTNAPGAVSPGSWHPTKVPGAIQPGAWHQSNAPAYVSPGSWLTDRQ